MRFVFATPESFLLQPCTEIGQIMFVTVMLGVRYGLVDWYSYAAVDRAIPGYAIGTTAMVWYFDRLDEVI